VRKGRDGISLSATSEKMCAVLKNNLWFSLSDMQAGERKLASVKDRPYSA